MVKALYAGSFDPVTYGHLDIITKASTMFDTVHVAVGRNPKKAGLFTPEQRVDLLRQSCERPNIEVGMFEGSVAVYARKIGATHIVRGLRQVSDFNDEFTYHGVLQRMAPDLTVVHLICEQRFLHVSSSTARELAALGEQLDWLVPVEVEKALRLVMKKD